IGEFESWWVGESRFTNSPTLQLSEGQHVRVFDDEPAPRESRPSSAAAGGGASPAATTTNRAAANEGNRGTGRVVYSDRLKARKLRTLSRNDSGACSTGAAVPDAVRTSASP